jgi:peroxiredoxin
MKHLYILLFLPLISACNRTKFIEMNGTVSGLSSGTVIVKDAANNNVATANIEGGSFHIKKILDSIGYFRLRIISDADADHRRTGYDVYLEPGTYTINTVAEEQLQYPEIKSSSATQTELSAYYAIANLRAAASGKKIEDLNTLGNSGKLSKEEIDKAASELDTALHARDKDKSAALQAYIEHNPKNHIEAHIMYQLDYQSDPETYNPIYQKFTDEQKKTIEGAIAGDKLAGLMKLEPGATAPPLIGNTPDGKAFDLKYIKKKVILIEFWRSDNDNGRANHANLISGNRSPLKNKDVAMVSVSLDTDAATWAKAIKEDGMSWTQISDLKGENSPNMSTWQVSQIPSYYLIGGDMKIIKSNIPLAGVQAVIDRVLKKTAGPSPN